MIRTLSVKETLLFSAKTRLPSDLSNKEKHKMVNTTLKLLGLDEIKHSLIGDEVVRGISGGQRKRVNIGIEVVSDPTVLFLDEPTSGLDSSSSKEVITALNKLAHNLKLTIAAVIHQPRYEIFSLFDDVLLLGKGGKTVKKNFFFLFFYYLLISRFIWVQPMTALNTLKILVSNAQNTLILQIMF